MSEDYDPESEENDPAVETEGESDEVVEAMLAFGIRKQGDKKIYGGGGDFLGRDPRTGQRFRMSPGDVRILPVSYVEKYNARSSERRTFVKPGSQVEGKTIRQSDL